MSDRKNIRPLAKVGFGPPRIPAFAKQGEYEKTDLECLGDFCKRSIGRRAFAVAALCLLPAALAQTRTWAEIKKSGVIRIGSDGEYAPFVVGEDGHMQGFEVDLGNEIFKRAGLKTEWVKEEAFDQLLPNLKRGKYDVVMASMAITPQRQRLVEFSNPTYCTGIVFAAKAGIPLDVETLKKRPVVALAGSSAYNYLRSNGFLRVKSESTVARVRSALSFGTADALLDDEVGVLTWAASPMAQRLDIKVGSPMTLDKIAVALPKGQDELKRVVNTGLAQVLKDGTYTRLSKQWLPKDLRCP